MGEIDDYKNEIFRLTNAENKLELEYQGYYNSLDIKIGCCDGRTTHTISVKLTHCQKVKLMEAILCSMKKLDNT